MRIAVTTVCLFLTFTTAFTHDGGVRSSRPLARRHRHGHPGPGSTPPGVPAHTAGAGFAETRIVARLANLAPLPAGDGPATGTGDHGAGRVGRASETDFFPNNNATGVPHDLSNIGATFYDNDNRNARVQDHYSHEYYHHVPHSHSHPQIPKRNCSRNCHFSEEMKKLRIEMVKAQILSKLRLKAPPNITARRLPQIPRLASLLDEFGMQGDAPPTNKQDHFEVDDYHSRTLTVINIATEPPLEKMANETNVCYFNFQSEVTDSKVLRGEFGFYVRKSRASPSRDTLILIYKLLPPTTPGGRVGKRLIEQQKITLNRAKTGRWYRYKIDRVVRGWIKYPQTNFGLQVEVFDDDGRSLAITKPLNEDEEPFKPYVEVQVTEKRTARRKRYTKSLVCDDDSPERRCCRFPLTVDFEEFQWDWIIAPKRYSANYCAGICPFSFIQRYPHTHLVTQVLPSDSHGNSGPCCTPTEIAPISMLYFDEVANIVYGKLPGMSVIRCGCA